MAASASDGLAATDPPVTSHHPHSHKEVPLHLPRPLTVLTLVLAIALSACKADAPAPSAAPAPPAAASSDTAPTSASVPRANTADGAATCPDADFGSFLKRFESSVDVQRASVADVVAMDSVDGDAQPEPAPVTKRVPRADLKFPILLGPEQRKAEGLEETLTELGQSEWEVKHAVPDSGMQVRFNFQATPCWTLVRVSDDTI